MDKRYLCPNHMYYLKSEGKSVSLSTEKCTICRWEKRPWTLKDFATEFRNIADNLEFSHDNPDYDPHGITYFNDLQNVIKSFIKSLHPDYRRNMLEDLNGN